MLPKVMIVEDDDVIREIYALKFEMEGYPIAIAQNGLIGLDVAKTFEPHIILLDMMMPVMGGLDFMRNYQPASNTDVIIFSNISAPQQMDEILGLGASEYWVKSDFTPDEVVRAVGERWSRRQATAA